MSDITNTARALVEILEAADRENGEPMASTLPLAPGLEPDWKLPVPIRLLRELQVALRNGGHGPRWRHLKRQSTYVEIGNAIVQAARPLIEGDRVKIYRGEADGRIWVRHFLEFTDGRFERLPADASQPEAAP
ncbi:hypothetical protein FZC33_11455 [Labrys sp. KNU-23]|uniref:hypothetical protein n=1 Tax=Labrys sp. KNU-23 TaxID=2789216 RepID=UPI0011EEC1A7|nr:hypothetical protein [Labrys sp. KNU-23]QEN86906.1 hypothetical protein FZC33_11455 [Labrys sp. KNU-23]